MPLPYTYFVKTTTIVAAASDSNDGRDPLGCALANASYDHTGGGSGERQLTAASGTPFASVQAGDYIYLVNAVGGVADGLYEIASVPSSTVILLVDDSGLTADSTSDVDSSDGPWLTLQYAFDTMSTSGSQLVICDDGNGTGTHWEYAATLDLDTNNGGSRGLYYRGGNGRGVVDGTQAVISGASLGASTNLVAFSAAYGLRMFDLRFTGGTADNLNCAATTSLNCIFTRCRIDNATDSGVFSDSDGWVFNDSELDSNGAYGYAASSNRSEFLTFCCSSVHDNTNAGVLAGGSSMNADKSLFYDNGGDGWTLNRYATLFRVDGSVFFGNSGNGVGVTSTYFGFALGTVRNSVFRSNGAYGLSVGAWTVEYAEVANNCFHNNTSGATDGVVGALGTAAGGDTNIYVDPLFVSETDGSEDFTPQVGSPLIRGGTPDATA